MHCIIHRMPLKFFFLLHHFVNIFGRKTVTCCFSYFTRLRFDRFYGGKSNVLSFSDDIDSIYIYCFLWTKLSLDQSETSNSRKQIKLFNHRLPFSLNHAIVRSTKIMKNLLKDCKIRIFKVIFQCQKSTESFWFSFCEKY